MYLLVATHIQNNCEIGKHWIRSSSMVDAGLTVLERCFVRSIGAANALLLRVTRGITVECTYSMPVY